MFSFDAIDLRPEWMKPPSWRWLAAAHYLANPTANISAEKDPYIREAGQFKRELKQNLDSPKTVWNKYEEMATAFQMYLNTKQDGWKWLIEAYLMTDLADNHIVNRLGIDIPIGVVKRYRKMFFDISSYKRSQAAVMANVMSTAKVTIMNTGVADYTWKIFAYVWGASAFEAMFLPTGKKRDPEHIRWMREAASASLDVYSYHLTSTLKSTYNEQAIGILNTAKSYWDIPAETSDSLTARSKKEFLDSLSSSIYMTILDAEPKKTAKVQEDFSDESAKVFYEVPNKS